KTAVVAWHHSSRAPVITTCPLWQGCGRAAIHCDSSHSMLVNGNNCSGHRGRRQSKQKENDSDFCDVHRFSQSLEKHKGPFSASTRIGQLQTDGPRKNQAKIHSSEHSNG